MANTPDRTQKDEHRTGERRREISGPGAADFLTAQGGADRPETASEKGTSAAQVDDPALLGSGAGGLAPHLEDPDRRMERKHETAERRKEDGGRRGEGR